MQSGWYATYDSGDYYFIDQWVCFGDKLAFHALKSWYGREESDVKDRDEWLMDYEYGSTDAPQLFATKEECRAAIKRRQSFEEAKQNAENKAKTARLKAALVELNGGEGFSYDSCRTLEDILKELDAPYAKLVDRDYYEELRAAEKTLEIMRRQSFVCQFETDGKTCIPLSAISRVSIKGEVMTIEMHTKQKYCIREAHDERLYYALKRIFEL